jgi:hypothetical protein
MIEFTEEDIKFCVDMAIKRNKPKTNQTISRGWPPLIKHVMGVYAEYACQKYLNATMDWNLYGKRGDRSKPDGVLPDGRKLIVKSVALPKSIWIPKDCLDNASSSDVVVAVQVIPTVCKTTVPSMNATPSPSETHPVIIQGYTFQDIKFLGWLPVKEFLKLGSINNKHYEAAESVPGIKLRRDICWVTPKSALWDIRSLCHNKVEVSRI